MEPTLAGFTAWVFGVLQIPSAALPSDSPYLGYAFNVAVAIVNPYLGIGVPSPPPLPPPAPQQQNNLIYQLAVYNLAADNLINWCPDQTGQTFFATLRGPPPGGYGINAWLAGVVTTTYDEATGSTLTTPEFMKDFTMSNLQNLKTPYGRQYLSFAQTFGPGLWGIS